MEIITSISKKVISICIYAKKIVPLWANWMNSDNYAIYTYTLYI
jgi:hypothetical protein